MRSFIFILFIFTAAATKAQIAGKNAFDFLNVPNTARISALGGLNVSLADRDINFFASNPALTGDTLSGFASANYQFYVADVGQAFFSFAHEFKRAGQVLFGVQHIRYGDIQGYDDSGMETSVFHAGETAVVIAKNHQISNFRLGTSLKGVFSSIAGYNAGAIMLDLGGVFIHPERPFTVGLVIKNIGFVMQDYSSAARNNLPFDIQAGATLKPEHMPLRFSLTAYKLTRRYIVYFNADTGEEKPGTAAKVLSHLNLGTEILVHKNVTLMLGYNYLMHRTLKLTGGGAGAGISLGFSAAIKSFEFVFSRNAFVAGNAGYSFTLSTNVSKLLKRR